MLSVVLPSGLVEISESAFLGQAGYFGTFNPDLAIVDMHKATKLKIIGNYAFSEANITNLEIPNSVTIKGKSSSADFTSYPSRSPFGWASGYSGSNIIWNG